MHTGNETEQQSKSPQIKMELYETDISPLQEFIDNERLDSNFSENYMILYNFASDLRFSNHIQPDLVTYLLPFYLNAMEQAVIYENKKAIEIYFEWNLALFHNRENLVNIIGDKNWQAIMEHYTNITLKRMKMQDIGMLGWVSQFNTAIALHSDNIRVLFQRIFEGSSDIRLSFFKYLTVLIFKESDNLLAHNEETFWTSYIWDFDDEYFTNEFFWSADSLQYYDKEINRGRIEKLYKEVKPMLEDVLEPDILTLFEEEMRQSFEMGIFDRRKKEYLQKIGRSEQYQYWDKSF